MPENLWERAKTCKEIRPILEEIARRAAGMTPAEREAYLAAGEVNVTEALDILDACAPALLGRPVPEGCRITWPEELGEAVLGFMCYVLEGDNAERILAAV